MLSPGLSYLEIYTWAHIVNEVKKLDVYRYSENYNRQFYCEMNYIVTDKIWPNKLVKKPDRVTERHRDREA
jgi:hypothetical protein